MPMKNFTSAEEARKFFKEHEDYTTYELAELLDVHPTWIRHNRTLAGIKMYSPLNSAKKPNTRTEVPVYTDPKIWNNKEWFEQKYVKEKYGMKLIARMINRSVQRVYHYLKKYGIKRRSTKDQMVRYLSKCCNVKWLMEHYATRKQYLEWCLSNGITPKEDKGLGLPIAECAKRANVVPYTVYNWLVKFKIKIRSRREAVAGSRSRDFGKKAAEERYEKISKAVKDAILQRKREKDISATTKA